MCGIAGALVTRDPERYARLVDDAVEMQRSRGPDHQGVDRAAVGAGCAIFGHDRLSVIDLSANANQPMWDAERRFCLTYNGEIYNYRELRAELEALGHRFRTSSDSEVLIEAFRAWGAAAVPRFNGMFAFGLLDRTERCLWLVRDRFGIKPLFYHQGADGVAFASTARPIARAMGLAPDLRYVARGVHYWLYEDDGALCQYEGLSAVPAGCLVRVALQDEGRVSAAVERWYDLDARVRQLRDGVAGEREGALCERLGALLDESLDLRLRADVPVGISLSGGLDSSTVAALVAERHPDVRGIHFGHPSAPDSEGPLVAQLVKKTRIGVRWVWPTVPEVVDAFWDTLKAQDAPFPGASIVAQYMVFRAAREEGLTVMLGGQGGDEVLMGYQKFQFLHLLDAWRGRRWRDAASAALGVSMLIAADVPRLGTYWRARVRYTERGGIGGGVPFPAPEPMRLGVRRGEPLWVRQELDVTRLSLPTLLRYEDRNSMGNGIESRLPFLDYRLVELGLALPVRMKVRRGYGKYVLRQMMKGRVPESVRATRVKSGFGVNQERWIDGGLGRALRARLKESLCRVREWVPAAEDVDRLFGDDELKRSPARLAEITGLLWIAGQRG